MYGQSDGEYRLGQELERLRATVAAAEIGTWDWDLLTGQTSWSDKNCELLGLPCGTVISFPEFLTIVHPDDRQRVEQAVSRTQAGEADFKVECRVIWPDGTAHWLLGRGHLIRDAAGKPVRMVGVSIDIADHKRIQEEHEQLLAERERQREFLHRLFDNAPIGIAVINARDGRYILANPTYEAVPGRPTPSFVGHHVGEFAPPQTAAFMKWVLQRVVQTAQPFSVREYETSMGPGREHTWWNNDVVPLLDQEGHVDTVLALTMEVTEQVLARKRIEELAAQTQASRDQLEAIINSMTEGLVVIDTQGNILSANPAALELHGYHSIEEASRHVQDYPSLFEMRHPDGRLLEREEWPVIRALQGETVHQMELYGRRTDIGKEWIGSYSAIPISDQVGQTKLLIVAVHDMTPMKQAEAALRASEEQLKAMNEVLEQRVAARTAEVETRSRQLRVLVSELTEAEQRERRQLAQVLHDHLQQLLVGAKLNLGAIHPPAKDHALRQSLTKVDDLLNQAIAASRSLTVELSPPILYQEGLAAVLHWLAQWMQEKHGLAVEVQADAQADPQAQDMRLLLFQSVRELLFNVVKHAKVDRARVEMSRAEGDMVQITVSDSGAGFDLAQRLSERTVEGRFGLFSIQQRLELMGGRMEVASALGHGTHVTLRAPIHPPGKSIAPTPAPASHRRRAHQLAAMAPQEPPPMERSDKIRVLLADDHDLVREGLAKLLQAEPDIEVVAQAWDGQMALERAIVARPDVVVMDVSMPGMDGVEAAQLLKAEMPEMHVIALSMHDEKHVAAAMAEAGAATYVNKADPSELLIDAIRLCARGGIHPH